MQDFFVKILFFARPLMGISVEVSVFGLGYFELLTSVFTIMLLFIFSMSVVSKNLEPVAITGLDIVIIVFCLYCFVLFIGFFEVSNFARLAKLVLPPITFVLLRRVISNRAMHGRLIWLMLMSFAVPIIGSTILIARGLSEQKYVYWTNFVRYGGMYEGSHELAHSVGFFVMCFLVYLGICRDGSSAAQHSLDQTHDRSKQLGWCMKRGLTGISIAAVYCIFWAQVRTVMVGLFVFMLVYWWFYSKKVLTLFLMSVVVVSFFYQDKLAIIFYDFMDKEDLTRLDLDPQRIGSGRFAGTEQRLDLFLNFPLAEQLLGIGIGNFRGFREPDGPGEMLLGDAHNDWMQVLLELGLVGFILVVTMYGLILQAILRIRTRERYGFLALWVAVVVMNLGSNSYINRVPIGQMFFMLILYTQLPVGGYGARSDVPVGKHVGRHRNINAKL